MDLYGRDPERAEIDGLLSRAHRSRSGVLVLRAEAGMGKTALLEYAGRAGTGLRVLRIAGVEPEAGLPHAALHRLLRPVLPLLDRIPEVQATALRGALAIGPAGAENRFAIALAVLSLLGEAAAEGPLLGLVDDAQWLDGPTADALSFVGRRLEAEGIVLLFAVRDGDPRTFPGAGLPELSLPALDDGAAERLLVGRFGPAIAPEVRRAVRRAAQGNPLALLEIPAVLSDGQLGGHRPLPEPMPLGAELERILLAQVHRLSPDAQATLLVAAADQETATVLEAAGRLGLADTALAEAEAAGLIRREGGDLVFRHPILRTAVYQAAGPAERRAAHRALVEVLRGDRDADRRAWHRAALAPRLDDTVADELEETAGRARRRGGYAAAAAALRRAADLSSGAAARARRLTGAARAAWDAGRPDETRALLRLVETPSEPATYAGLRHLEGELEMRCGLPAEGAKVLLDGAAVAAAVDPARALGMLLDAAMCAIYAGDPAALAEAVRVSRALPPERLGDARPLVAVLDAVAGMMSERPAGPEPLLRWLDRVGESTDPRALIWAGAAAAAVGDRVRQERLRRRAERIARRSAQVGTLAMVLERIAWTEMTNGQVGAAAMHAAEGLELSREAALTNSACFHLAVLSWTAAVRGEQVECLALAGQAADTARSHGLGPHLAIATWAVGLHHLGAARWAEAVRLTGMAAPGGHPYVMMLALPDLVEAAVRAGHTDTARNAADRYLAYVGTGAPPWHRALTARCRALTGPVRDRRELLTEALALHGSDPRPFGRARTQLLLGEHLRRERRRAEARPSLAEAAETFDALGAAPWAARARAELRATGETARRRAPDTLTQLTPQQARIARMVAGGATNKEVAAHLFLSPRTVDYHLRNVFAKLGVAARSDLIRLGLGGGEASGGPPGGPELER